jgi:hypothetical protein
MSSFFDKIKDKLTPEPSGAPLSTSASRGIGNRGGTLGFEDDNVSTLFPFKVFACVGTLQARCSPFWFAFQPRYVNMLVLSNPRP